MLKRHQAREVVLKALFQADFNNEILSASDNIDYIKKEFNLDLKESEKFLLDLIKGVLEYLDKIDKIINFYAKKWPVDKITIIDRNILRMGIYELLFSKEIPPKVAINEAIELSKEYGGVSSKRFINGVLGAIYNDIKQNNFKVDDIKYIKKQD